MFLILLAASCVGVGASKLLLTAHLTSMLVRYPLAVVCSYLAFFGFVKLWLVYLSASAGDRGLLRSVVDAGGNSPDLSLDLPTGGNSMSFSSGGGSFGGGGSSASFEATSDSMPSMTIVPSDTIAASDSGVLDGLGDSVGSAASGIFDDDGVAVLLILAALLALALGAGVYLIYQAPAILSDVAFQAILSSGLLRSMKRMSSPDWIGSVFRATVLPFLGLLVIASGAAWVSHAAYPQATRIADVLRIILAN